MRDFGLAAPLWARNVSNTEAIDYRSYYGARKIQIVADWYVHDIETFAFEFESAARRNTFYTPSKFS